jgi:glycosyl transferase family 25
MSDDAAMSPREARTASLSSLLTARVISLTSSHERRRAVEENLKHFPYPWSFFDALTGESPSELVESPERQMQHFGRRMSTSEVGCFKSHVQAIVDFERDPDMRWLLVVEDDVWLDTQFDFADILNILETRRIHYFRLFARRYKKADVLVHIEPRQIIRFRTDPHGMQAYLIDKVGARRLRGAFQTIDRPIDDEVGRFWVHGLDQYSIFPFPAVERGLSILQTTRAQEQRKKPNNGLGRLIVRAGAFVAKRIYNLRARLRNYEPRP